MEYVDLVHQIVAAEHSAKRIEREARARESALEAEIQQEASALRTQYLSRARRRVEQVEQTEAQAAAEAIVQLDRRLEQALDAVEASYQQNKAQWVQTLFSLIVGGGA